MADDDDAEETKQLRRVYVLERELVDRILAFQKERKLSSEVEAARILLDRALKYQDSDDDIIGRFIAEYEKTPDLQLVAQQVLAGHPHVSTISFRPDVVTFTLRDEKSYAIDRRGKVSVRVGDAWHKWESEIPF